MTNVSNLTSTKKIENIIILFSIFLLPILLFIIVFPSDWFAWSLIFISFMFIFISKTLNRNLTLIAISLVGLSIHYLVALINSYVSPTFGAESDALVFYSTSAAMAELSYLMPGINIGSAFYKNFLTVIFMIFGDSIFLACVLSVLSFFISYIYILKIAKIINYKMKVNMIASIYIFLPSIFLFSSVTLRESYQMMFLTLGVYFGLKYISNHKGLNLLKFCFIIFALSFWHNILVVVSIGMLLITLILGIDKKKYKFTFGVKVVFSLFAMISVIVVFIILTKLGFVTPASQSILEGNALEYSNSYREVENSGGSSYNAQLNSTSLFGLMTTYPIVLISYLFAPFPWQIRGIMDIYAALEGFLRFVLIIGAYRNIKRLENPQKKMYIYVFLIFIFVEMLWAAGTLNWGTAMRHHIISFGLLLAIGYGGFYKFTWKKHKRFS